MAFELDWATYAEWLIRTEGLDFIDALSRVSRLYYKQYGKALEVEQAEQLRDYIEERF